MKIRHALPSLALSTALATLLAAFSTQAVAQTIASKLEQLGEMNQIKVTALRTAQRNGLLKLQATFANRSPGTQELAYRIKWLDQDGFDAWEEEAWKPVLLHGRQQVSIQSVAPTPGAVDFRIEVHSPDNSTPILFAPVPGEGSN